MKRAGKCIGKRAYPYSNLAIDTAKKQYVIYDKVLGYYECTKCLDFHLTSKYCNLQHLHKDWDKIKTGYEKWGTSRHREKNKRKRQRKSERKRLKKSTQISQPLKTIERKKWGGNVDEVLRCHCTKKVSWIKRLINKFV